MGDNYLRTIVNVGYNYYCIGSFFTPYKIEYISTSFLR